MCLLAARACQQLRREQPRLSRTLSVMCCRFFRITAGVVMARMPPVGKRTCDWIDAPTRCKPMDQSHQSFPAIPQPVKWSVVSARPRTMWSCHRPPHSNRCPVRSRTSFSDGSRWARPMVDTGRFGPRGDLGCREYPSRIGHETRWTGLSFGDCRRQACRLQPLRPDRSGCDV